jgi:Cd2+/Zn2+-exporting ATPase
MNETKPEDGTVCRDTFTVTGMDCGECARRIDRAVGQMPGVERISTSFAGSRLSVDYDPGVQSRQAICARVRGLGYGVRHESDAAEPDASTRRKIAPVAAAVALLVAGALAAHFGPKSLATAAFAASILAGGWSVFRGAVASLRAGLTMDINVLMSIAVIGAAAIGQWEEGAAVLCLYAIGEWLEGYTVDRTRGSIRALLALAPPVSRVVEGRDERTVRSADVAVGATIRVRPGERIPLDGNVATGLSAVNQAAVTGESVPVEKRPGEPVFAGTLNGDGVLDIVVTRPESESTVARIVDLVRDAQDRKAPSERFVDRFSRYYTPAVIALSVAVAALGPLVFHGTYREWFYRALVLLVASCPCALVISTPVAIVSALGSAARRGILIKGGAALEAVGRVDIVAFDKTGTLTEGFPTVVEVVPATGVDADAMFSVAAALEAHSSHPLGDAVRRRAAELGLKPPPVSDFITVPGMGIRGTVEGVAFWLGSVASVAAAQTPPPDLLDATARLERAGRTVLILTSESGPLGLVAVTDRPRAGASVAIQDLARFGIQRVALLTGDALRPATAVAISIGLDTDAVRAGLMPGEKQAAVRALGMEGRVAMVGDGVNDAPALAEATVGIAMGAIGSDAAMEAADIALMGDDLAHVRESILLGRRTMGIIRQNVAIALGLKLLFVAAVLAGWATLWMAVVADTGASVLVTLNAMRLMRGDGNDAVLDPAPDGAGSVY